MPNVDVTELLEDADFAQTIYVTRTTLTAGSNGRPQETRTTYCSFGVVTPAAGDALQVVPEALRVSSMLQVATKCELRAGTASSRPDEVRHRNRQYVVVGVQNFMQWGRGFVIATLAAKELLPP